jgi:FtsH-binding integral membrane protein
MINYIGFMRKVYSLLSIQLAITTIIGATLLLTPGVKQMVQVLHL